MKNLTPCIRLRRSDNYIHVNDAPYFYYEGNPTTMQSMQTFYLHTDCYILTPKGLMINIVSAIPGIHCMEYQVPSGDEEIVITLINLSKLPKTLCDGDRIVHITEPLKYLAHKEVTPKILTTWK